MNNTVVPFYNYIVVNPNGDVVGFHEEKDAREYITGYYVEKVDKLSDDYSIVYGDYSTDPLQTTVDICTELGVYEGDCVIYDLESFLQNIRESEIFQEEKDELIAKLLQRNIDININDCQIDDILMNTKVLPRSY